MNKDSCFIVMLNVTKAKESQIHRPGDDIKGSFVPVWLCMDQCLSNAHSTQLNTHTMPTEQITHTYTCCSFTQTLTRTFKVKAEILSDRQEKLNHRHTFNSVHYLHRLYIAY